MSWKSSTNSGALVSGFSGDFSFGFSGDFSSGFSGDFSLGFSGSGSTFSSGFGSSFGGLFFGAAEIMATRFENLGGNFNHYIKFYIKVMHLDLFIDMTGETYVEL